MKAAKAGEGKKIQARRVAAKAAEVAWYVAEVFGKRENLAVRNLRLKGFRVFAPTRSRLVLHARRKDIREEPLFPGYVFVGVPAGANRGEVRNAEYVSDLVGASGPVEVDPELLARFARMCALGDFDRLPPAACDHPFAVGETVVLTDGFFAQCRAVVDAYRSGGTAELLVSAFGRRSKVVVDDLARVAVAV